MAAISFFSLFFFVVVVRLFCLFVFLLIHLAKSAVQNNIAAFCFSRSQALSSCPQLCLLQTGVTLLVDFQPV